MQRRQEEYPGKQEETTTPVSQKPIRGLDEQCAMLLHSQGHT